MARGGKRDLDIVVYGASGFAGRLVAKYLVEHAPKHVRVGLAGRAAAKLAEVRRGLGPKAADIALIEADSADNGALLAMAQSTHVVATTAGPFWINGLNLVEACVEAGTHYADLTGEVLFERASIDRFDDGARQAGVRIVHSCGFDSIPSDLGVLLLHQAVSADGAGDMEDTTLVVKSLRGSLSGGTIATGKLEADLAKSSREHRRVIADPYALSPDRAEEPSLGPEKPFVTAQYDSELRTWVGPFIMATINTRAVRRSNALQSWEYGLRFRYREVTGFGDGPMGAVKAGAMTAGLGTMAAALGFAPMRPLLDRALPKPGEGPSEKLQREGRFKIEIHTRTSTGARYVAEIAAPGDPGYAATSVMLGEAALCLALDQASLPKRAGVLTPATAMGLPLVERLRAAGHKYEAHRVD